MSPCDECNRSAKCKFRETMQQWSVEAYNKDEEMPECDFYVPRAQKGGGSKCLKP